MEQRRLPRAALTETPTPPASAGAQSRTPRRGSPWRPASARQRPRAASSVPARRASAAGDVCHTTRPSGRSARRRGAWSACSGQPAGIFQRTDRPVEPQPNLAEVDLVRHTRSAKTDLQVLVVTERFVPGLAAPAQRRAGQYLDRAVIAHDGDGAADEQRSVADRRHGRGGVRLLLTTVEPAVLQRAAWTSLHDLSHDLGVRLVWKHPRPALELEHLAVPAQALGDVHTEVEVEADLDVPAPVNLPHLLNTRLWLHCLRWWLRPAEHAAPGARRAGR